MRALYAALLSMPLWGCSATNVPDILIPIGFEQIPGWSSDATDRAFAGFRRQCDQIGQMQRDEKLGGSGQTVSLAGSPAAFAPACLAAREVTVSGPADARRFFEHWFAAYDAGEMRMTGYFEPEFAGSLTRGDAYQTPVLGRPADLVTVPSHDGQGFVSGRVSAGRIVPYPTRAEIDHGALAGRGLELLWLSDPIDLFFLQLQGSGRIRLPTGQVVRVGYAGKTGRPHVPLGRLMVERGLLAPSDDTPSRVRDWLEDNKDKAASVIESSPDYVFFRILQDVSLAEGAPGALGVPLTPFRSVAAAKDAIPLGTPVFYDAPGLKPTLAFDQDVTGDKADLEIFFGWGKATETSAGAFRARGHQYILLPRPTLPST